MTIEHIAIIGAGQMGNGIAQVSSCAGYKVTMIDIKEEFVEKGMQTIEKSLSKLVAKGRMTEEEAQQALSRISTSTENSSAADADLVVEAIPEVLSYKTALFEQLDSFCKPETILATNTSSISIDAIASATNRPDRVIGMHFMNPVPVMKLVEVIRGYATSNEVTQRVMEMSRTLGKSPVEVNDYPGFVANRILMPMINESIETLFQGVAGVEEIDTVMMLGMAHPMGPLHLADFIGLDVCLSILEVMQDGFGNPKYAPNPLLVNMVMAGKLGIKSGEGFYDYSEGPRNKKVAAQFSK